MSKKSQEMSLLSGFGCPAEQTGDRKDSMKSDAEVGLLYRPLRKHLPLVARSKLVKEFI
jgi:hypothetical protein